MHATVHTPQALFCCRRCPASRRETRSCRAAGPPPPSSVSPGSSQKPANLVLIGGRGCGKSSISRRIASLDSRWTLLSVDQLIRYEADGATVADIVAASGWSRFRDLEYLALTKCAALPEWALIDAGGGAIVDVAADGCEVFSERKAATLRRNAVVCYVKRDVKYLQTRLAKKAAASSTGTDAGRPSLSATESFEAVMARRSPWYEEVAHVVIDGCEKDGSPREKEVLTAEILRAFWSRTDDSRQMSKGACLDRCLCSFALNLTPVSYRRAAVSHRQAA